MRLTSGLALGFAAGVLALGAFLYGTGKLNLGTTAAPVTDTSVAAKKTELPTPAPPDTSLPVAPDAQLPPPPNLALTAAPPETHSMPVNGKLDAAVAPAAAPSAAPTAAPSAGAQTFGIALPLKGLKKSAIQDTFNDTRGGGKHEATDIMAPRGTPIYAVVEGNVVKLFNSKKGGTTLYQYDNAQKYCYYYAHMDKYAEGIKEGMLLRKGDLLGYVGSTGDAQANAPHLHFAILELGPDKHWWEHTTAINPYSSLIAALGTK